MNRVTRGKSAAGQPPESHADEPHGDSASPDYGGARVELKNVAKTYGSVRAVVDFSLDIAPSEFVAILGPSGSGKTTLFMSMLGFEKLDSGRLLVDGRDVTSVPPYKREFGIVFQKYALFPHMSVGDNIAYGLRMRGVPRARRSTLVREALDLVDLSGFASRQPDQLSGGQQQRVALARALVFRPKVLLMDEPLGALDRKLREQVQIEIRRIHRELGTTILHVTHDQEEAMVLADKVAVMRDGRLLQYGTPTELYDAPAEPFVADFLGRTNFLPATITSIDGDEAVVTIEGHRLGAVIPAGLPEAERRSAIGQRAQLAVRPEQITISQAGAGLPGTISDVIFTGPTTSVNVDLGWARATAVIVSDVTSRSLQSGDSVTVSWPAQSARVYPE